MKRQLIVNADGFGFGPGATQGVLDAIAGGGPITSVSVNANFSDACRLGELIQNYPHISIGVHLNPIVGKPCLAPEEVPSLVGEDGFFRGVNFRTAGRRQLISLADLESEFNEQIRQVKQLAERRLTHLDSHQNSHLAYFRLFVRLARQWNIPYIRTNASLIGLEGYHPERVRLKTYLLRPHLLVGHLYRRLQMRWAATEGLRMADRLVTVGYAGLGNKSRLENWERILRNLPEGTYEIYCHPAYPDDLLRRWASYVEPRRRELAILSHPHLRELATSCGVRLVSFLELLGA